MKKQIFIHVGPPKTGTSAIQEWFNDNNKKLEKWGIFYPTHSQDSNGISSGNLFSLYSRNTFGEYFLDEEKLDLLINDFSLSKSRILFLSSEFFFLRMNELKEKIPSVKFIGYLRNPMEKRESQYNQGVKRHFITEVLANDFGKKGIADIQTFQKYIDINSINDIILRFYGADFFHQKSIISDILNILEVEHSSPAKKINPSYHFEALELKRWLNNFTLGDIKKDIDTALQKYDQGKSNYSLIKPELFKLQASHDYELISVFLKKNKLINDVFLEEILNNQQKIFQPQKLEIEEFKKVSNYLLNDLGKYKSKKLINLIKQKTSHESSEFQKLYLEKFNQRGLRVKKIFKFFRLFNKNSNKPKTDKEIIGLEVLKKNIGSNNKINEADLLRDLALFAEVNDEIEFALVLMLQAQKKRSGPIINKKIRDYRQKI
jgi:hypothetical protein